MPRIARLVIPGLPHHVTQKGNRGQAVFFAREDRLQYLKWCTEYSRREKIRIWAYCLMSNHVHFVAVPDEGDALASTFRNLHMRHSQRVNARKGWQGHLWQGRFFSCALDERHLYAAVRYVEQNPVRAGLVERAEDYPWSSAAGHCGLRDDPLLSPDLPLRREIKDWSSWLRTQGAESTVERLRTRTLKGLPCGSPAFLERISRRLGVEIETRPVGRPRKVTGE